MKNPMVEETKFLKRRLMVTRLVGLLFAGIGLAGIALLYLKKVDEFMAMLMILFSCACTFSSNSYIQSVRVGRAWQVVNLLIALLFYGAVIALIIYGLLNGKLSLTF